MAANTTTDSPRGQASFLCGVTQMQGRGTKSGPGGHIEDVEPPKKNMEVDSSATSDDNTAGRAKNNTRIKNSFSGHKATSETADETQAFAAILSMRPFTIYRMQDIWMKKDMVTYSKHLMNQTLRGLTVKGFCLDTKDVMKIRKANTRDVRLRKLESVLPEHLSMDAAVIECLWVHITEQSVGSANKKKKSVWREHVWPCLHVAGICTIWAILATILL